MLKRIFNFSSPVGIALTVAGVVLALSPEARKATRRMLVKGTAFVLGTVDQARNAAADLSTGVANATHQLTAMADTAKHSMAESAETETDMMMPAAFDGTEEERKPDYH